LRLALLAAALIIQRKIVLFVKTALLFSRDAKVSLSPRTGELRFTRPAFNQQYTGALSGNWILGTFGYGGQSVPWEARRPR
jgi:hypothetical protein